MGASASTIASHGDSYVNSELRNVSDTYVTVTSLAIMQRPLGSIGGFQRSGKLLIPGLGQHEFIIVDLSSEKFILAEKLGRTRLRPAGIYIVIRESDPNTGYCRYKCNLLGVTMKASELIQILVSDGPDYNLFTANCWKYAFRAAQNILKRCIAEANITSTAREFLLNEHQRLLDYEKNSPARYRPVGFAKHHPEYFKKYRSIIPIANQGTG